MTTSCIIHHEQLSKNREHGDSELETCLTGAGMLTNSGRSNATTTKAAQTFNNVHQCQPHANARHASQLPHGSDDVHELASVMVGRCVCVTCCCVVCHVVELPIACSKCFAK